MRSNNIIRWPPWIITTIRFRICLKLLITISRDILRSWESGPSFSPLHLLKDANPSQVTIKLTRSVGFMHSYLCYLWFSPFSSLSPFSTTQSSEFIRLSWLGTCVCVKHHHAIMHWCGQSNPKISFATLAFTISSTGQHLRRMYYTIQLNIYFRVSRERSLTVLCESNQLVFSYFQTLSLAFNFCLCHDLIKTLNDPFSPGKRRMKFYFWISIVLSLILTLISSKSLTSKD